MTSRVRTSAYCHHHTHGGTGGPGLRRLLSCCAPAAAAVPSPHNASELDPPRPSYVWVLVRRLTCLPTSASCLSASPLTHTPCCCWWWLAALQDPLAPPDAAPVPVTAQLLASGSQVRGREGGQAATTTTTTTTGHDPPTHPPCPHSQACKANHRRRAAPDREVVRWVRTLSCPRR